MSVGERVREKLNAHQRAIKDEMHSVRTASEKKTVHKRIANRNEVKKFQNVITCAMGWLLLIS